VVPAGERSRRSETRDNGRKGVIRAIFITPFQAEIAPFREPTGLDPVADLVLNRAIGETLGTAVGVD